MTSFALARGILQQPAGNTLQPTALVHEAYLRLINQSNISEIGRTHFLNLAARAMRQVLTDHARKRLAYKRGGNWQRIDLGNVIHGSVSKPVDLVSLDEALSRLAELNPNVRRELSSYGSWQA